MTSISLVRKNPQEKETEGIVYLLSDRQTMERVASEILNRGERTGAEDIEDKYERYGLFFSKAIDYILCYSAFRCYEVQNFRFEGIGNREQGTEKNKNNCTS